MGRGFSWTRTIKRACGGAVGATLETYSFEARPFDERPGYETVRHDRRLSAGTRRKLRAQIAAVTSCAFARQSRLTPTSFPNWSSPPVFRSGRIVSWRGSVTQTASRLAQYLEIIGESSVLDCRARPGASDGFYGGDARSRGTPRSGSIGRPARIPATRISGAATSSASIAESDGRKMSGHYDRERCDDVRLERAVRHKTGLSR